MGFRDPIQMLIIALIGVRYYFTSLNGLFHIVIIFAAPHISEVIAVIILLIGASSFLPVATALTFLPETDHS